MRILFLAGREIQYPRNDVLLRALNRIGQVEVLAGSTKGSITLRSLQALIQGMPRLLWRKYDLVLVGFYGHLILLPLRLFCRTPILFDAFLSTYDTLCLDRKTFSPTSIPGRLAFWLDQTACSIADHVLLDTPQYVQFFTQTFDLPEERMTAIPVGCNEDLFYPQSATEVESLRVLFYSTYLPLHGVDVILRAAAILKSEIDLHFRLIGRGATYPQARALAEALQLDNVEFIAWLPLAELAKEIAAAGICLGGHFGCSAKAQRVIPGKMYALMAMAKPIIAGDTLANRELLIHGESTYFCAPSDPEGLASAIRALHREPELRARIAEGARARYERVGSEAVIRRRLAEVIEAMDIA